MLIVNQNKDELINFENIMNIGICGENEEYSISAGFIVGRDDNYRELGVYKTEERAKEVLQKIIKFYDDTQIKMMIQSAMMLNSASSDFVYQMPEE